MNGARPLRLAVVAGEESGDLLGADLAAALARLAGRPVELLGVGGRNLEALGLHSLFDAGDIALMGISAVLRDLPRLVRRIGQTAAAIVAARPDCLVTIDSPDFSLRVARKVRAADPSIPIVHYVCPSVWAWRPGRAPAMRPHVDHVLCLLPFEPDELARLGGPPGTFVGHRLVADAALSAAASRQAARDVEEARPRRLLVLPGSRRGEVARMLPPFGATVAELAARGNDFEVLLPTVPHVEAVVRAAARGWAVAPRIVTGEAEKYAAFADADAALACSGTVLLELALAGVPMVACYSMDPVMRVASRMITVWSASLPNLIADWPVVPEHYNEMLNSQRLARNLERLWRDTPLRRAQLDGFGQVKAAMRTGPPSGELAAGVVLDRIGAKAG